MTEIDYKVKTSSKASNPRIDVSIREVNVVLPEDSDLDPDELVEEKKDWIAEKRQKYNRYLEQAPERGFNQGEVFLYKGKERVLKTSEVENVEVEENRILLPKSKDSNNREVLRSFFRRQAKKEIMPLLREYRDKMDVDYEDVSFRNQKTLWGSCSPNETLSFNWRLVMGPPEVVEYVVVHELAHLQERNHTKKFWRIVEEYYSDYKESSQWLEENAPKMIFTEEDL
ncbi:DUF45 domain-containing protein [Nanohaloarchaea archaeon]|nr:DUF45 domain-containing protein [Candidatus Nanohaloarchaea archaeon]